jgi:hypothetical protein
MDKESNKEGVRMLITTDSEEDKEIIIFDTWKEVDELNDEMKKKLDETQWGFSDEWITCSECGRAILTTPRFYGDKPRYAIIQSDLLCGDCIHDKYMEEYVDNATNNVSHAINTGIVSEEELQELGWKKLQRRYEKGLHEGQIDEPIKVLKKLSKKLNVIFTYETGQFDVMFWAWVKTKERRTGNEY